MTASSSAAFSDGITSPNPPGGRPRMALEQRAKIFTPFDPLEGFAAALRAVEEQVELERLPLAQSELPLAQTDTDSYS